MKEVGINIVGDFIVSPDNDHSDFDNLERYHVADEALQAMVRGDDLTRWRQEMLASGFVMDSPIGLGYLDSEQARAETIYLELQKHLTEATETYTGQLELAGYPVQGQLNNLVDSGAVYYRCGALKKSHLLEIWINHLFANASGLEIQSISISKGKQEAQVAYLKPVNQSEALQHLNELANLFTGSVTQPLCFPPETAFSYVESMQEVTSIEDAKAAAEEQWGKGSFPESSDPYWSRLINIPADLDSKFIENAHLILDPLLYHWEESQ